MRISTGRTLEPVIVPKHLSLVTARARRPTAIQELELPFKPRYSLTLLLDTSLKLTNLLNQRLLHHTHYHLLYHR